MKGLSKLLCLGVLTHEDPERRRLLTKTAYTTTFTCPSCKKVPFDKRDRCPKCNAEMKRGLADPRKPRRSERGSDSLA